MAVTVLEELGLEPWVHPAQASASWFRPEQGGRPGFPDVLPEPWFKALAPTYTSAGFRSYPTRDAARAAALAGWESLPEEDRAAIRLAALAVRLNSTL